MSSYAVRELARRAYRREIPSFLETGWEAHKKENPVALAIRLDQNENKRILSLIGVVVVVSVFSLSFLVDRSSFPLSFILFLLLLVGCWITLKSSTSIQPTSFGDEMVVEEFWNALCKFEQLIDRSSREFVHKGAEELARKIASGKMKVTASQLEAGAITNSECSARYDMLVLFGLVPPGGYGQYFPNFPKQKKSRKAVKAA